MGRREWIMAAWIFAAMALFCFGCTRGDWEDQDPLDTWENPGGDGPQVLFQTEADPPLMPFPNDIATKEDPTTVTGRRINITKDGDTDLNKTLRRKLRELDGFGTMSPVTISFDLPIDIETITNDNIFIINVNPDSERYGEITQADFGDTQFLQVDLEKPESFFPNDPEADNPNILFAMGNRVKWYEDETNTIIMRPLTPLEQSSTYAVVVTRRVTGEDGEPIRPPHNFEYFTFPTMLRQTERAVGILHNNIDLQVDDVGFVWCFTTQTITNPLENVRKGLHGEGPFAYLHDEFPPQITEIHKFAVETQDIDDEYVLGASFFEKLFGLLGPLLTGDGSLPVDEMLNMTNVEYIVSGTYTTSDFLATPGRYIEWDWQTGDAIYDREEVPFFFSIPKPTAANNYAQPPYPVVIFQHANIRCRLDSLALANAMAIQGMATIGIDAAEHGPETYLWAAYGVITGILPAPPGIGDFAINTILKLLIKLTYPSWDIKGKTTEELAEMFFAPGTFFGSALIGRSVDMDGDGVLESGNTFYSADMFRTRAISQQTLIDLFQLTRILKNMGTDWDGDGHLSREEGDFNQDGVLDVGGPDLPTYFVGMSLGSILGSAFIALEPEIEAAVLNVPGGILTDILQRNQIPNVNNAIRQDLIGPIVIGRPRPDGDTALTFNLQPIENEFAVIGTHPGARAVLMNLDNKKINWETIGEDGNFAVNIPCDEGDWIQFRVVDDEGTILEEMEWAQEFRGMGVMRNTPVARSFVDNAQWAIDAIDPINFVPFFQLYPRPGNKPKKVLMQMCMPDTAVPTSAGLALARSAGFIDRERELKLKKLGIYDFGYSLFIEANLPFQSLSGYGWRIHPGYNHEYLLAPRAEPNSIMYSFVAKNQAAIFLKTNGEHIEDNVRLLVPDEYYVPGY